MSTGIRSRVGIYARVSTGEQTVDNQLPALREYARTRGWTVTAECIDEGVSGATASRPGLDRLMREARQRRFDVALVWRFDRFARSTKHLVLALDEFQTLGVDFVSLQEAIDTGTPMGKAIFTIFAAMAELERAAIVERVKAGVERARREGKVLGRPRADLDLDRLVTLRQQGLSVREIARRLGVSKSRIHVALKTDVPKSSPVPAT
ncbi:MAG: recombinase family protein [Planctomycetota bacterium]|nr:recombinase family protein [Planctomycetota bacterium]